jgi:sialate O-acetylesterase
MRVTRAHFLLAAALAALFLLPAPRVARPGGGGAAPDPPPCASPGGDSLRFSNVFSDNVVLEAGPSRVWGWVEGDCPVRASLDGHRVPIRLDGAGLWVATLPPQPASVTPRVLALRGGGGAALSLVVRFGRVFACVGQSNMVGLGKDSDGSVAAALAVEGLPERAEAEQPLPLFALRVGQPLDEGAGAAGPRAELPAGAPLAPWAPAARASDAGARDFSAVCWFLGRAVAAALGGGVPVGLIESAWGGSAVQAWSTPAALAACAAPPQPSVWWLPGCASCFYNSHVAPFAVGPLALSGFAVYIGETQALFSQAGYYGCGLRLLLRDLGAAFGGVPWAGVVELAPWESAAANEGIAAVRAAQLATARGWARGEGGVAAVSIAPSSDCGDPAGGIHPRRKRALGLRLGRAAVGGGAASGPAYLRAEALPGGLARVVFAPGTAEGGLRLAAPPPECPEGIPASACMGLQIQLSDGAWRPAEASVEAGGGALLLRAAGGGGGAQGLAAVATRSGWSAFPLATVLAAASGLPAHPWSAALAAGGG